MSDSAKWYVIHTYSGYENAVKTSIEKFVTGRGMEDTHPADGNPHGDGHGGHASPARRRKSSGRYSPAMC